MFRPIATELGWPKHDYIYIWSCYAIRMPCYERFCVEDSYLRWWEARTVGY